MLRKLDPKTLNSNSRVEPELRLRAGAGHLLPSAIQESYSETLKPATLGLLLLWGTPAKLTTKPLPGRPLGLQRPASTGQDRGFRASQFRGPGAPNSSSVRPPPCRRVFGGILPTCVTTTVGARIVVGRLFFGSSYSDPDPGPGLGTRSRTQTRTRTCSRKTIYPIGLLEFYYGMCFRKRCPAPPPPTPLGVYRRHFYVAFSAALNPKP